MLPLPNQKRAYRAAVTISAYSGDYDDSIGVAHLLADVMHWCDATGEDFHLALARACRLYLHEIGGESPVEVRKP